MVSRRLVTGAIVFGSGSLLVGGPLSLSVWERVSKSKPTPDQMLARRIVSEVLNHQGVSGGVESSDHEFDLSLSALLLKVIVTLGLKPEELKGQGRNLTEYFLQHPTSGLPSREVHDSILRYEVAQTLGWETTSYLNQFLTLVEAKLNAETQNSGRQTSEDSLAWRYYAFRALQQAGIKGTLVKRLEAGLWMLYHEPTGEWREFHPGGDSRGVTDLAVLAYEANVERERTGQLLGDPTNPMGFWTGERVNLATLSEYCRVFPQEIARRELLKTIYFQSHAQEYSSSSQALLTHLQVAQALAS